MKRIDRYITRGFVLRFFAAIFVIFGLYISFDAVKRIDQIQQGGFADTVPKVLLFYAYQFPTLMLDLFPPLLLVAAGLVLVQMSREKELLTLKASGISLRRVVLPILITAVPLALLTSVARETVVPWSFRRQKILDRELDQDTAGPFLLVDEKKGFKLYVGQYNFSKHTLSRISLLKFYSDGQLKTITEADRGHWTDNNVLQLETVSTEEYAKKGNLAAKPSVSKNMTVDSTLRPYDFVAAKNDAMSTSLPSFTLADLFEQVRRNPNNSRFRVMLHSRLAEPLAGIILLLIGIPLMIGFEHTMKSRVLGVVVCIVVAGVYQVSSFVMLSMGNTGYLTPAVAAWSMPVIGLMAGSVLFYTMRT